MAGGVTEWGVYPNCGTLIVRNSGKPEFHPRLYRTNEEKMWMPGTRFTLAPAEGRTRVPGMTNERLVPLV